MDLKPTLNMVEFDVQMDKIHLYADIVDDYNPIHVDPEFAAASPMGGVIAHGTMSLALVWQSLRATYDAERLQDADVSIRFVKPVRVGDTLTAGGDLGDDAEYRIWVRNQAGVDVINGRARVRQSNL